MRPRTIRDIRTNTKGCLTLHLLITLLTHPGDEFMKKTTINRQRSRTTYSVYSREYARELDCIISIYQESITGSARTLDVLEVDGYCRKAPTHLVRQQAQTPSSAHHHRFITQHHTQPQPHHYRHQSLATARV